MKLPKSIDATGKTDVTAQLADCLNSAPDGTTIQFPKRGNFRIDDTVEVRDKHGLILAGNSSSLIAPWSDNGERGHLRFANGGKLRAQNFTIEGASRTGGTSQAFVETLQWQHGVACWGVQGIELANIRVMDALGDGFYFGIGSGGVPTRSAQVFGGSVVRNGRQGIAAVHVEGLIVDSTYLNQISLMTFNVEPNPDCHVHNAAFTNCRVGQGPRQQMLGIVGHGEVDGVVLSGTHAELKPLTVWAESASGLRIKNVSVTNNVSTEPLRAGYVLDATAVDGLTMTDNVQPLAGAEWSQTKNCTDVTIHGNA